MATFPRINKGETAKQHLARKAAESGAAAAKARPTLRPDVVLFRESSIYAHLMMVGMISKVATPLLREFPELQQVIDLAPQLVLREDEAGPRARAALGANDLIAPSGAWWGWEIKLSPSLIVLICPASAAKLNDDDSNDFTDGFVNWVPRTRPRKVWTGPFSRQGRRVLQLAKIRNVLEENRVLFGCAENSDLDVTNESGKMYWNLMAQMSENELINILERTFAGKVFHAKRGEIPNAQRTLPLGILRDSKTGIPSWDPKTRDLAVKMLVAASEETDAATLVARWSKMGVPRMDWGKVRDLPLESTTATAGRTVEARLKHIDTYLTGTYVVKLKNPLPRNVDEENLEAPDKTWHGEELHYTDWDDKKDSGHIYVPVEVGEPLIDMETAAAIRRNWTPQGWCGACTSCLSGKKGARCEHASTHTTRETVSLLAGMPYWADEETQYRWTSRRRGHYEVQRRALSELAPSASGAVGTWWQVSPGNRVASVRMEEFHPALAAALRQDPAEVIPVGVASVDPLKLAELNKAANERAAEAQQLREDAASLRSTAQRAFDRGRLDQVGFDERIAEAVDLEAEADELEAESEAIVEELNGEHAVSEESVSVDATALRDVVLALESGELMFPRNLRKVANRVLGADWSVSWTAATVTVTTWARVPLATGVGSAKIGPYVVTVNNYSQLTGADAEQLAAQAEAQSGMRRKYFTRNSQHRLHELLKDLLSGTETVVSLAERHNFCPKNLRARFSEVLEQHVPAVGMRSAVLSSPVVWPRLVVAEMVFGVRDERLDSLDPQVESRIRATYADPEMKATGWVGQVAARRALLDYVRAYRNEAPAGFPEAELAAVNNSATINGYRTAGKGFPATFEVVNPSRKAGATWTAPTLDSPQCPHCAANGVVEHVDHVQRAPEVWDAHLCPTCGQEPNRPGVWPAEYRMRWLSPQELGNGVGGNCEVVEKSTVPTRASVLRRIK